MDTTGAPQEAQLREILDRAMSRLNTCLPGTIDSFDAATQTVTVTPAIQMKVLLGDSETFMDLPQITNVPLVFPFAATAGFALTLPVRKGDPCLLVFSQRAIDNWHNMGGSQPPESGVGVRHHDLTDAFAIFAPSPLTQVLGEWEADGIEIRNRDKTSRVTVKDASVEVQVGVSKTTIVDNLITLDGLGEEATNGVVQGDCICPYTRTKHVMISDTVKSSL